MSGEDLRVRNATLSDLPEIVRMLADDPLGARREQVSEPLPNSYVQAFEAIERDPNNELVVAEDPGHAVVGVLQITFTPHIVHRGGWRATIEGVRVERGHRHAGVGRGLMDWAIERARDRRCRLVQLTTDKLRRDARRFYEGMGFSPTHEGMKLRLSPGTAATGRRPQAPRRREAG